MKKFDALLGRVKNVVFSFTVQGNENHVSTQHAIYDLLCSKSRWLNKSVPKRAFAM